MILLATGSIEANVARRSGYQAYFETIHSHNASLRELDNNVHVEAIKVAQSTELKIFNETMLSAQVRELEISPRFTVTQHLPSIFIAYTYKRS